jgi:hypothetical protein
VRCFFPFIYPHEYSEAIDQRRAAVLPKIRANWSALNRSQISGVIRIIGVTRKTFLNDRGIIRRRKIKGRSEPRRASHSFNFKELLLVRKTRLPVKKGMKTIIAGHKDFSIIILSKEKVSSSFC